MKNKAQYQPDDSGLTFFEAFQKSINKYEIENPKQYHKNDSDQFTIYEDLKLLLELSKIPQIESKHFEKISVLLNRSKTCLRKRQQSPQLRYQEYLKNINQEDLQTIYHFIQKFGANGYLVFHAENGLWRLQDIEPIKKQGSTFQTPLKTPIKVQEQQKVVVESLKQSEKQQQEQKVKIAEPESVKKVKLSNKFQLSANSKYDQSDRKLISLKQEKGTLDQEQKQEAEELRYTLKLMSEYLKIPFQELVQRLYQCSGDLNTLLDVYLHHQEQNLWTKEADDALRAYLEETNELEKQKLATMLNGEEQIQKRKEWLLNK